jgi:hypothetical protein
MKKILLLSAMCFGLAAFAPQAKAQIYTMAQSGDTVTNTETETLTLTVKGAYDILTFQYVCVKLSGTVAGTAILQGSLDGTNFIAIDTVTNTNVATQTFAMFDNPDKYVYYRVVCTGSGTMAARVYVYVLGRNN